MYPFLCRGTVHPRNAFCSPWRLIWYALASAGANSSLSLAVVSTTVKSSMLTAAIIRTFPIFWPEAEVRFALLKFVFA